jgi:hypothetical protein
MNILDKNQTLQPPDGFGDPVSVVADGAYLRVEYRQNIFKTATRTIIGKNVVNIFLNDQGREVARSVERKDYSLLLAALAPKKKVSVSRRFRFKNGFLIVLEGLQEMFR